jgi:hypothetical protein
MLTPARTLLLCGGAGLLLCCTGTPLPPRPGSIDLADNKAGDMAGPSPDLSPAPDLRAWSWPQVVVMQSQLRGFVPAADRTASVAFARGPGSAPLGLGSLSLRTGPGTGADQGGKAWLYLSALSGSQLADFDVLQYHAYVSASSTAAPQLGVSVNLQVDVDGDGQRDTTLVFEPVYVPAQGTVTKDTWQRWDAGAGRWWATVATAAFCSPSCTFTLRDFAAAHPMATIVEWGETPGFALLAGQRSGGAWANFDGYVDRLVIGRRGMTTTYDLEPEAEACAAGGFARSADPSFQSEAECAAYHR